MIEVLLCLFFLFIRMFFFICFFFFFFFKQKTAYEISVRDWSSDVCSSDLHHRRARAKEERGRVGGARQVRDQVARLAAERCACVVEAHLGPQGVELAREPRRDPSLTARVAVDPDELLEEGLEARGLDHERRTLPRRSACRTPGGDVSSRAWRVRTRS